MPSSPSPPLAPLRPRLCESVRRHLESERELLEEIRQSILDWPATLVPSPRMDEFHVRIADWSERRSSIIAIREELLSQLQLAFEMPGVRRFSMFGWGDHELNLLEESFRQVRLSAARLSGAVRATSRTLQFWSQAVAGLLADLSGENPRAGRYSPNGHRIAAHATSTSVPHAGLSMPNRPTSSPILDS